MLRTRDRLFSIIKVVILLNIVTHNDSFIRQIKRYQLKAPNAYQWNIMNNQIMNNLNNLKKLENENLGKYTFFEPVDSTVDELSDEILLNAANTSESGM